MCQYVKSSRNFKVGDLVEFLPTSLIPALSGKQLQVAYILQVESSDEFWYRLECKRPGNGRIVVDANEKFFMKWQQLPIPPGGITR